MQAAVNFSGADFVASPATSPRRASKFLVAGAAMVTAGALVAGPATQSLPAEIQQRVAHAVELTGLSVTASPLTIYPTIVTNTVTNIAALTQAVAANPLPILSQVATNQAGYLSEIGDAIFGLPARWQTYSEGRGATFLANFQAALADGNTAEAVNQLSSYVLYGLQAAITPIYNTFLTYTPRGTTTPVPGIPQRMAQNFANAVGALFSTTTFVSSLFQPVYGATLSVLATTGDIINGLSQSVAAGNIEAAINTVVNTPGLYVNAVLNGWNNPKSAAPFPALLTFIPVAPPTDPANGVTVTGTSIGLLGRLLVSIPQSIANAIKPVNPAPSGAAAKTAAASAAPAVEAPATDEATAPASTEATPEAAETTESTAEGTASLTRVATTRTATKVAPATSAGSSKSESDKDSATKGTGSKKAAGTARSARAKASAGSSSDSSDSK